VEAIQAAVNGRGIEGARFSLLALGLTGIAGCLAGAKLFRWDANEKFAARAGKAWLVPALGAWVAVGLLAEWRGRIAIPVDKEIAAEAGASVASGTGASGESGHKAPPTAGPAGAPERVTMPAVTTAPVAEKKAGEAPALPGAPVAVVPERKLTPPPPDPPWAKITQKDIDGLDFNVPPDQGIVSPFAGPEEAAEDFMKQQVDEVRRKLPSWPPGGEEDDLRSVRNILYVAAVPDAIQMPVERYLPRVVYEYLTDTYPKDKLTKILTYIALHPEEGPVIDDISDLGIEGAAGDPMLVRERAYLYAIKMIARLTERVKE
jgi:hypothetical protein